ncbi:MAG: hypothetical protein A3C22_02795 [Candidatus Levybacteria bacterium RIFCSPHIGHO2_02_FULL_37_10]|nr:MAG: hypothetical protein A3C22_02795 [Candidatus Levybacteria bacterium RIFCSPHIGHO2_02_FULL_37_10]
MRIKLFLADALFWLHFLVGSIWLGLFLVPSSVWHDKITFHFYLTIAIVGHQFLWGLILMLYTRKFRMVCILTTPMQVLRGEKISDPKNYDHSFFKELVGKNGIKIPHLASTLITFSALSLAIYQYLFLR